MKETRRITYETTEKEVIINNQGEITEEVKKHTQRIRCSNEPPFIKLYLDHLSRFKGLQISLNTILAELLKRATYANSEEEKGGMILYINKSLKSDIAKKCEVSLSRVDHAITEFVKKKYMKRLETGKYQFNPYFFGKGEWKDIENIRAVYDYNTGEVKAEIEKEKKKE